MERGRGANALSANRRAVIKHSSLANRVRGMNSRQLHRDSRIRVRVAHSALEPVAPGVVALETGGGERAKVDGSRRGMSLSCLAT